MTTGNVIDRRDLEVAAAKWARHQQRRNRSYGPRWSKELFLQVGTEWSRFLGRWQEMETVPLPLAGLINDFVHFIRRGTRIVRGNDSESMLARGKIACMVHEAGPFSGGRFALRY
jgi:hypothetical protein